jgi:hypothetical protein
MTENFDFLDYRAIHPVGTPLLLLKPDGTLQIYTSDEDLEPEPGDLFFSLTGDPNSKQRKQAEKSGEWELQTSALAE